MTAAATRSPRDAAGPATGSTTEPGTTPGRRRSALTWVLGVSAALILIGLLAWFGPSPASGERYAPDNPEGPGARAAVQILQEQGVEVTFVRTTAAALADSRDEGTLLIVEPDTLRSEQLQALAQAPGDVVLAGFGRGMEDLTEQISLEATGGPGVHPAGCEDRHALAAGQISSGGPQLRAETNGTELCFGDTADTGRYASWTQQGSTWRALSTPDLLTNDHLAQEGNAALVLRILGQQPHLTWYLPDPGDDFGLPEEDAADTTMPLLRPPAIALAVLVALALILWRGRRLGPVVTEPLPVVVRATETTRGRGRLYRRHRTHAHAGTALRAGTIARLSGTLGLARWSGRDDVVQAIARACGRSTDQIDSVLYGPPPDNDESLAALAQALQMMESEVQQR